MSKTQLTHHLDVSRISGSGLKTADGRPFVVVHLGPDKELSLYANERGKLRRLREVCNRGLAYLDGTMKEPSLPSSGGSEVGDKSGAGRDMGREDGFRRWAGMECVNLFLKARIFHLQIANHVLKFRLRMLGGEGAGLPSRVQKLKPLPGEAQGGDSDSACTRNNRGN